MTDNETGWELEKRTHFDEIVLNYDRTRPEYPEQLFEDIFSYIGSENGKKALEIGAGTGKATTPFVKAGYDVTAVELSPNMSDFLLERFKGSENFKVTVAAFEDIPLESDCYDLIYAASSIHWMDAEIACPKIYSSLKIGGVFALLRYDFDPPHGEGLYGEIPAIYEKHYHSYYKSKKKPVKRTRADFMKPAEILYSYGFEDLGKYGFKDVSMKFYDATRTFYADEYIAFLDTLSDHRNLPNSKREALYADLKEVIHKHGGLYNMDYVFRLYIGRKA